MNTNKPYGNGSGFSRALRALRCSLNGLYSAFVHESAFRQELALSLLFIPYSVFIGQTLVETLFLILLVLTVLVVELLNSAIEAVVDRVGLEHHELSGRAKDVASAAVFICLSFTFLCFTTFSIRYFYFS